MLLQEREREAVKAARAAARAAKAAARAAKATTIMAGKEKVSAPIHNVALLMLIKLRTHTPTISITTLGNGAYYGGKGKGLSS